MTTWHLDTGLVSDYLEGSTSRVQAASVEAHLLGCADCRAMLATGVDRTRLDDILANVLDRVDAPHAGPLERLLCRLGISGETARLLAATPSLGASWLLAVAGVLGMAVVAASSGRDDRWTLIFLALAPLAPVAGVAVSFGRRGYPAYQLTLSAPYSAFRLLMVRALAVLATTTVLAGLGAVVLPTTVATSVAWLLPALALTGLTLSLSAWFDPIVSAFGVTVAWLLTLAFARDSLGALGLFSSTGQVIFAVIAASCAVVVLIRRDSFTVLGGSA